MDMSGEDLGHRMLLVNVGPNEQIVTRTREDPKSRTLRKFKVQRFQVILADDYLCRRLDPDQAAKTPEGNRDPSHPWDYLRWYELEMDVIRDDAEKPKAPAMSEPDPKDKTPWAMQARAEWSKYRRALCRLPVDLDKVAKYFDPVTAHDYDFALEPRGNPVLVARQCKWWLMVYPWHARQTYLDGYVQLVRNSDEKGTPGSRNKGRPFVDDTTAVEVFARNRRAALDSMQRRQMGTNLPRNPFQPRDQAL